MPAAQALEIWVLAQYPVPASGDVVAVSAGRGLLEPIAGLGGQHADVRQTSVVQRQRECTRAVVLLRPVPEGTAPLDAADLGRNLVRSRRPLASGPLLRGGRGVSNPVQTQRDRQLGELDGLRCQGAPVPETQLLAQAGTVAQCVLAEYRAQLEEVGFFDPRGIDQRPLDARVARDLLQLLLQERAQAAAQ